jgi:hypothetical protein
MGDAFDIEGLLLRRRRNLVGKNVINVAHRADIEIAHLHGRWAVGENAAAAIALRVAPRSTAISTRIWINLRTTSASLVVFTSSNGSNALAIRERS